jgi:hypothetical protein
MDTSGQKDHYSTLGVDASANAADIHDAYRRLAKQYHPDYAGDAGTAKFQDFHDAYEVLSDPEKRNKYEEQSAPSITDARKRRTGSILCGPDLLRFGDPPAIRLPRNLSYQMRTANPWFNTLDAIVWMLLSR